MSDEPRNPFLLPPGGQTPAPPAPAGPAVPPGPAGPARAADPSRYIAVPASVESVTHRIPRPDPAPTAADREAAEPEPDDSGAAEDTRVAAPRRWLLMLADGSRTSLPGPLLLGRDPAAIADRPDAGLMPLVDPGKTVSKTHALLEPEPGGVRVRDLHSTNGVAIDTLVGRQLMAAGGEGLAPLGATIMLGSFAIVVATG